MKNENENEKCEVEEEDRAHRNEICALQHISCERERVRHIKWGRKRKGKRESMRERGREKSSRRVRWNDRQSTMTVHEG